MMPRQKKDFRPHHQGSATGPIREKHAGNAAATFSAQSPQLR